MELGRTNVDGWLDRGPAHQLFKAVDGRLVYRLLPTAARRTRELFRPTVELFGEALRDPRAATPALVDLQLDDDGDYLVICEDVEGASTLGFGAPVAPVMALALASRVLEGLAPLHRRGLYHGALNPGRVLIDSAARPVLYDAGAALMSDADPERRLNPSVPGFADLFSAPAFVPPEIFTWQALSPASDVFLVSALAYRWLAGRPAHGAGRTMEIYARLRDGRRDPFPTLQANLNLAALRVLEAGLEPNAEDRPTPDELLTALRPFAAIDVTRLLTLAGSTRRYADAFAAMNPEDAPGPPGSAGEQRRQEALKRASLQLEMMKSQRPDKVRKGKRGGLWMIVVALVLVALAIPVLIERFKRDTSYERPKPDTNAPSAVQAPPEPVTPAPDARGATVAPPEPPTVEDEPPPRPGLEIKRRQPEPEAVHPRHPLEPVP